MFDLPASKRVRRVDLFPPPGSSEDEAGQEDSNGNDGELTALLRAQLENLYGQLPLPSLLSSSRSEVSLEQQQQTTAVTVTTTTTTTLAAIATGVTSSTAAHTDLDPVPIEDGGDEDDALPEHGPPREAGAEAAAGYEFRLFAAPKTGGAARAGTATAASTTRIILDEDDNLGYENGGITGADGKRQVRGAFVVPFRDEGYYFTGGTTRWGTSGSGILGASTATTTAQARENRRRRKRTEEFDVVAVSGADVRLLTGVRYSGLELPWRVKHVRLDGNVIPTTRKSSSSIKKIANVPAAADVAVPAPLSATLSPNWSGRISSAGRPEIEGVRDRTEETLEKGRTRKPNKKRRIILRVRKWKVEEVAERKRDERDRKARVEQEREVAEREKRTRRNRERKVKRKLREKGKKKEKSSSDGAAAGLGGMPIGHDDDDDDDGGV